MDLENVKNLLKTLFIDLQAIGFIIGVGAPLLIYKLRKKDSLETSASNRKKEFDKQQIDKIVDIFRNILSTLNTNSNITVSKKIISPDLLSQLEVEVQLARCFDDALRNKITTEIYKECLYYNEMDTVKNSRAVSATELSEIEKEKREFIERNILEIISKIRQIYSNP